jgi:ATP-dependent DNA helicase RecG
MTTVDLSKYNTIDDLNVILSEGESYTVEFKEAPDKSLPSEVCAFANASGGRVFIGVKDNGVVVGTDTSSIARARIQDTIGKIEPRLKVESNVVGNIVVLTVPEGTQKPYSCPAGFYLRSGPNSQKLDRDSIIEFFQSEGRVHYDEIIREDLPITERFNEAAYKRYIKAAHISDVLERDAILKNLECAGMANGRLCYTNAGALFFRINDEDVLFRHAGIVCALYKGTDKATILDAKELNGDIVSNVDDAMVFLKKHLRVGYKIETLKRENVLELPEDALREAIVNAACHRLYFEKGARIMVEVFDDRVDVTSPGGACKGITEENFGTVSITRNPVIVSMFFRIDYIEQMGTGITRMRNAAKAASVAEPEFRLADFFKVTFRRPPVDESKDIQAAVSAPQAAASGCQATVSDSQAAVSSPQATASGSKVATAERKREILSLLEADGRMSSTAIAEKAGLTAGRIRTILREMVAEEMVEKVGDNRYATYVMRQSNRND